LPVLHSTVCTWLGSGAKGGIGGGTNGGDGGSCTHAVHWLFVVRAVPLQIWILLPLLQKLLHMIPTHGGVASQNALPFAAQSAFPEHAKLLGSGGWLVLWHILPVCSL
jgi:hypothetical protein